MNNIVRTILFFAIGMLIGHYILIPVMDYHIKQIAIEVCK